MRKPQNWNDPGLGAGVYNRAFELLAGELGGNAGLVIGQLSENALFRRQVADYMLGGCLESTLSQREAEEIMGENFFGVQDYFRFFGKMPEDWQLRDLETVPFKRQTLEQCANSHVLIAIFPLSIAEFMDQHPPGQPLLSGRSHRFLSKEHLLDGIKNQNGFQARWSLLCKDPDYSIVTDEKSGHVSNDALRPRGHTVPDFRVLLYAILAMNEKTNRYLFKHKRVRSSTVIGNEGHLMIDGTDGRIMEIRSLLLGIKDEGIGWATEKNRDLISGA